MRRREVGLVVALILAVLVGWGIWATRDIPSDCGAVGYGEGGCP